MNVVITIIQMAVCIILIGLILLQSQGGGLGTAWGGSGYYYSKRGVEKTVLYLTIIFSVIFFFTSILNFVY